MREAVLFTEYCLRDLLFLQIKMCLIGLDTITFF